MTDMRKTAVACLVASCVAGCLLDLPDPDEGTFACSADEMCLDGYTCIDGKCRRTPTGGGDSRGGNGDTGSPGDGACPAGFTGPACDACEADHYGATCEPCTCTNATCDDGITGDGSCECLAGYGDCTGGPADGCETYLVSGDPQHCGNCITSCNYTHADGLCVSSQCQMGACDTGYGDCNTDPSDGCETHVLGNDRNHCGTCNEPCLVAQTCAGGSCLDTTVDCYSPGIGCEQTICYESGRYAVTPGIVVDLRHERRLWHRLSLTNNDFTEANNFCNNATTGGLTGWRLPTYAELADLLYQAGGLDGCPTCNPAIDQAAFDDVPSGGPLYWTTDTYSAGYYHRVSFCDGRKNYPAEATDRNYARCTHDPVD